MSECGGTSGAVNVVGRSFVLSASIEAFMFNAYTNFIKLEINILLLKMCKRVPVVTFVMSDILCGVNIYQDE